jgi:hypothetical protein
MSQIIKKEVVLSITSELHYLHENKIIIIDKTFYPSRVRKFDNLYIAYMYARAKYFGDNILANNLTKNIAYKQLPMGYNHIRWLEIRKNILEELVHHMLDTCKSTILEFYKLVQIVINDTGKGILLSTIEVLDTDNELSIGKTIFTKNTKSRGQNLYGEILYDFIYTKISMALNYSPRLLTKISVDEIYSFIQNNSKNVIVLFNVFKYNMICDAHNNKRLINCNIDDLARDHRRDEIYAAFDKLYKNISYYNIYVDVSSVWKKDIISAVRMMLIYHNIYPIYVY